MYFKCSLYARWCQPVVDRVGFEPTPRINAHSTSELTALILLLYLI